VYLDAVGRSDGLAFVDGVNGAADPDAGQLSIVDESAGVRQPSIGEQVEALVQAALGMGVEVGGALSGAGASVASAGLAAALPALGRTACNTGLVDIADDGGEVAIADPDLAAARVGTKPALGVAEIAIESVADAACSIEPELTRGSSSRSS
jgi:hypothetical protein